MTTTRDIFRRLFRRRRPEFETTVEVMQVTHDSDVPLADCLATLESEETPESWVRVNVKGMRPDMDYRYRLTLTPIDDDRAKALRAERELFDRIKREDRETNAS